MVPKDQVVKLNKDLEKATKAGTMEITGDLWENCFSSLESGWVGKGGKREGNESREKVL